MASSQSYTITHSNNASENEAIKFLVNSDKNFIRPDLESRKKIMALLNIQKRYQRAFDLVLIEGHSNLDKIIELDQKSKITLIELKTTKKFLPKNPSKFFFGATENEFNLARTMKDQFKFCFVSLHSESLGYSLLTLSELDGRVKSKRIQYQINLI